MLKKILMTTAVAVLFHGTATAKTELKLSHYFPTGHGVHTDFVAPWVKNVSECSNGELSFEVFTAGAQLGNVARQQEQVLAGVVDLAVGLSGTPRGRFPRTSLIDIPFLTRDAGAASYALWELYPQYLAPEYKGMKVLALFAHNGGLIQTSKKKVETIEDMKGLRIRTPSPAVSDMLSFLGALPQGLPPGEMYENIQRGVIDGTVFPWDPNNSFGLNEVVNHHLDAGVYTVSFFFAMNQRSYDKLSQKAKTCIDTHSGNALQAKFGDWWNKWDEPARADAKAKGHNVTTLTDSERERWKVALQPMIKGYIEKVKAQGVDNAAEIYQKMQEKIREYESRQK